MASEDVLLVIECKTAFHPCGPHEMRTSFDHIKRAGEQLTRLREVLRDPTTRAEVLRALKWPEMAEARIATCVVTGNRLFNGYITESHPVCQAYELINLLMGGEAVILNEEFKTWNGDQLTMQHVLDYIGGLTTHQDFFESMEPTDLKYEFGRSAIVLETYRLDMTAVLERFKKRYKWLRTIETPTPEGLTYGDAPFSTSPDQPA